MQLWSPALAPTLPAPGEELGVEEWARLPEGAYSGDREEPPHVHVERESMVAKFWLSPVRLQRSGGFGRAELRRVGRLIETHGDELLERWDDFFAD